MKDSDRPRGAILQRDKRSYAIVPRTPLGLVTPEILENIARVARKHDIDLIKITSAQRMALIGLEKEAVEEVWKDLDMDVGPATEVCVHYVQACPGTDYCKFGKADSLGLGAKIEEMFVGRQMPAKVKIGVSGCALCCAESYLRDVGLFAKKTGWTLVFGGNAAAKPRIGDVVATNLSESEAIELTRECLEYYQKHAKRKERTSRFIRRHGIEPLIKKVLAQKEFDIEK